jgi:hypothetical protein
MKTSEYVDSKKPANSILQERILFYLQNRINGMLNVWNNALDRIGKGDDFSMTTESITCSQAAKLLFHAFKDEGIDLENSLLIADINLEGECGRWMEDAIQTAGLLCCIDGVSEIDGRIARNAIAIVRWCKRNFLKMLTKYSFDAVTKKFEHLEYLIEKSEKGFVTVRDIKNRNGFTDEDIEILKFLFDDEIRIETKKGKGWGGGRPSTVILLKPFI